MAHYFIHLGLVFLLYNIAKHVHYGIFCASAYRFLYSSFYLPLEDALPSSLGPYICRLFYLFHELSPYLWTFATWNYRTCHQTFVGFVDLKRITCKFISQRRSVLSILSLRGYPKLLFGMKLISSSLTHKMLHPLFFQEWCQKHPFQDFENIWASSKQTFGLGL